MNELGQAVAAMDKGPDYGTQLVQHIFAVADVKAVFSEPVVQGEYTVITASEIGAGGGFGFGRGFGLGPGEDAGANASQGGGSGGGGGGGAGGRPVAVIVIGPDGVKVQPVVDVTKFMLGAISAWVAVAMMLGAGRKIRLPWRR